MWSRQIRVVVGEGLRPSSHPCLKFFMSSTPTFLFLTPYLLSMAEKKTTKQHFSSDWLSGGWWWSWWVCTHTTTIHGGDERWGQMSLWLTVMRWCAVSVSRYVYVCAHFYLLYINMCTCIYRPLVSWCVRGGLESSTTPVWLFPMTFGARSSNLWASVNAPFSSFFHCTNSGSLCGHRKETKP